MVFRKAFTLIELLIVVAIIAILAAIAVPNFLEAQTRAKISRNYADFRTAATALETYHIDYNTYAYDGFLHTRQSNLGFDEYNSNRLCKNLTTPVAYLNTCIFPDPFAKAKEADGWQGGNYKYWNTEATFGTKFDPVEKGNVKGYHQGEPKYREWRVEFGEYLLFALGPDGVDPGSTTAGWQAHRQWVGISKLNTVAPNTLWTPYNATNGTLSIGNIMRSQKAPNGYVNAQQY